MESHWIKRHYHWIRRAIIAVITAFVVIAILRPKVTEVESARVVSGELRETLVTEGILRTRDRRVISAPADGDIRAVRLRVGDPILKGQVITEIYWDLSWDPIRSPMRGTVSQVIRETAGPIRRGDPLIEIIDPERLEIMLELLTSDALQVRLGAEAKIRALSTQEAPILAKVVRISRAGYKKYSALGVEEERTEVLLWPTQVPPSLRTQVGSTFHVDAELLLAEHPSVLKVPMTALFRQAGQWQAFRIEKGRARQVFVDVIARSREEAAVSRQDIARSSSEEKSRRGLKEGDLVVVSPGERVKDGDRVQAPQN